MKDFSKVVKNSKQGPVLAVHAQPGASRTEIAGLHGEALKIRLKAPPVDGKANQALCEFLAESFGIPKSRCILVSGETSRQKKLCLEGLTLDFVLERLRTLT